MSATPLFFKSPSIAWADGGTQQVPLDFLHVKDGDGNRIIVEKLYILCAFSLTTGGGETLTAYDLSTLLKRLVVKDSQGKRRDLSGTQLRVHALMELGDQAPADPATFGAGQTAAAEYVHVVPFVRRKALRSADFGIPADDLHDGGYIEIAMPGAAEPLTNGGAVAVVSGTYTVIAECRTEHDLQFHARDVVVDSVPGSDTDVQVPVNGRAVRGITLVKEAEGTIVTGGTAVTTVTDVTIDAYGLSSIPRRYFKDAYITRGIPIDTGRDPVYNDRALPLVVPPRDAKIPDMKLFSRNLLIRLNSTFSGVRLILDFIAPRSDEYIKRTCARHGLPPDAAERAKVKTAKPSQYDAPRNFGAYRLFMPAKVA